MSSEQPKLNDSEENNNQTSGESQTAPQENAMASQPAPATQTPELAVPTQIVSGSRRLVETEVVRTSKLP